MTNNKLRIAAYTRVALDEENKKEYNESIIKQRKIITDGCNRNFPNCTIDFYTDTNCSGMTFDGREEYSKLREKLFNKEYDMLVFTDISRFTRVCNEEVFEELQEITKSGVRIISIGESLVYDTDAPDNWLRVMAYFYPKDVVGLHKIMKEGGFDAKKFNRRST